MSIRQLYFQRQKYLENGEYEPPLEKICYCHQYFNPDFNFKTCKCGNYFHSVCFLRNESNKCWNQNCNVDCSIFFSQEEIIDKKRKINLSQLKALQSSNPTKPSVVISENFFGKGNIHKESNKDSIINLEEILNLILLNYPKKERKKMQIPPLIKLYSKLK